MNNVFLSHESWGPTVECYSVNGSGFTTSNMIRLESSGSCEEVRQKILRISWSENGTGYLPQGLYYVNRKSVA
ncbi:UNVERIFIED_CONTAM: hypothetical protein Sradi_0712100 [Sesamum radiatum]|uniref:Uncharacterized protein n=1 Tax=Sesamum radiatum TaxID=300843 RepID=A0AAW2VRE8_SESRA